MPEPSVRILEPEAGETPAQTQTTRPPLVYKPQPEVRQPIPKALTYNPTPNTEVIIPGQARGLIFRHLETQTTDKTIALSFDDGPNAGYTQPILEVLRRYGVKATFFWLGREVNKYPELALSVVAEGHAVGNHTWDHRTATTDEATAQTEIEGTAKEIEQATRMQTRLFRPPGGRLSNGLSDWALRSGYTVVIWSAQSNDWKEGVSVQDIVQNVLQAAQPGGIVLMHDGGGDRSRTVAALPQVIEGLQAQGYRFVTVPELLELQARLRPQ